MGRRLALFNMEWRQRVLNARAFQTGFVLFTMPLTSRRQRKPDGTMEDVGVGLRRASRVVLRADYGFAISRPPPRFERRLQSRLLRHYLSLS
jgi:hypothetical protein